MDVKKWFRDLHPTQIYLMLVLTALYFALQLFMSHTTHALTLLVDAYHTLCNLIALAGCIISMRYGSANTKSEEDVLGERLMCDMKQTPSTCPSVMAEGLCESSYASEHRLKNTFGWARIDVLVTLIGCVFLASLCFSLIIEALLTLIHIGHHDEMHHPILVFTVGIIGLLLNGLCLLLIGGYTAQKGKFLHTASNGEVVLDKVVTQTSGKKYEIEMPSTEQTEKLKPRDLARDIVGSILVIICSLVVYFTDEEVAKYVDPIFSIFSVVLLMVLSYPYLKKSGYILLQTIPDSININVLRSELLKAFPDIVNVHDLHIWQLTTRKVFSTAHIIFLNTKDYTQTTKEITKFFHSQGITQVTIQPEFLKTDNMNGITVLPNAQDDHCLVQCQDPICQQRHCCVTDKHELHNVTTLSPHNDDDVKNGKLKSSNEEVQVVPTKEVIITLCTDNGAEIDNVEESEELKKLNCENDSCEDMTDISSENSQEEELKKQVKNCEESEVKESGNTTVEDAVTDIHL